MDKPRAAWRDTGGAHRWLRESFGEYAYPASEILFALDEKAYAAECQAFAESGADNSPGEGV